MSCAITTSVLDSMENRQGALGAAEVIRQQIRRHEQYLAFKLDTERRFGWVECMILAN